MKVSFYVFVCLLLFFYACNQQASDSDDDGSFDTWLQENRIPQHKSLLDFSYSSFEPTKGISMNKVEDEIIGDTLIAKYYSSQAVGCLLIGDIAIHQNTIELKLDQACNPLRDAVVTEEADLMFVYKISNSPELEGLGFTISEDAELMIK